MNHPQILNIENDYRDLDYWKNPQGVAIANDRLKFLYIPDYAEHMMMSAVAKQVFEYQRQNAGTERQITQMVMIAMGALLPGVLLHDYITHGATEDIPPVEFGTFGVKYYHGPGQPLAKPEIVQRLSIDVHGHTVAIVEDLADLGGTARFVRQLLISEYGARDAILIAPYLKTSAALEGIEVLWFGKVPADTWIITPRERVETMMKRVPYWREQGASRQECIGNLFKIGYPQYLIDDWFHVAWQRD